MILNSSLGSQSNTLIGIALTISSSSSIRACKADVDGPLGLLAALARRGAGFEVPDFDSDLRELDFAAELLGISNLPSVKERLQSRSRYFDDKSSN